MKWLALIAALAVTTAGVAFVGPPQMPDMSCQDDPHPGIEAANHWFDDRTLPPAWACRFFTSGGDVWRAPQYGALYRAAGIAAVLLLLVVAFRRHPPPALQGVVVAWLTVATFGAFATYDLMAATVVTPFVVAPCIAHDLRRPIPGLVRWWWAAGITVLAWVATVLTAMFWGEMGNPWPALVLGALLGAVAPRRAKYPAQP